MEYIDGEDLASLMKRIGHLSNEKALDIARQLVAGLSVAHERGVLHRDLKPANIMLDGHGRVRITDFGLAIAVGDESQAEEIAGTPAYMAPEQLAGKGATVRSDIYSLGLILYEIYTGKKAFKANTLAELQNQKETQTPRAPSELRDGIDPVVERVIQRCMEKDPNSRPASVAQLAQALPGGDPLAAAIAAGETPSPEMVAASGSREGLRPAIAWGLLLFIIAGTLCAMVMKDRADLHRRIPFEKEPGFLVERCREILKNIGYSEGVAASAYGFEPNDKILQYIEISADSANLWQSLGSKGILFWYRQSPSAFNSIDRVSSIHPPLQHPGEVVITLDTQGRLYSLRAVPPVAPVQSEMTVPQDWGILFKEAGLDIDNWTDEDEVQSNPLFYVDSKVAWSGSFPECPDLPVQIEAASYQDKPILFESKGPWDDETASQQPMIWEIVLEYFLILLVLTAIGGGIVFARRNLRLGRGDRRNAKRLSLIVLGISASAWILQIPHSSSVEILLIPYEAGLLWIFYMALEPFMRRRWPQILVSWTRALSGNWKDVQIGRDILIGVAMGVLVYSFIRFSHYILPGLFGYPELAAPFNISWTSILGPRFFISGFINGVTNQIIFGLLLLCLLFIMMLLLRNRYLAIAACCVLLGTLTQPDSSNIWSLIIKICATPLWFIALIRFGLLVPISASIAHSTLVLYPIGFQASAWYAGYGYAALAILAALVLYAFYTSLGGRPIFGTPRLDD